MTKIRSRSTAKVRRIDGLGRPTTDSIPAFGSGVDSTVKQIARTYEIRGMLKGDTSYSSSAGTGTAVNDVLMVYNDFGQLTSDYQAHAGAVSTSGAGVSPAVQYTYSSGTANTIRPLGVVYPSNSRTIAFGYNAGVDDNLSRVSYLTSSGGSLSSGTLSQFGYLGLGRIVTEAYPIPGVTLDYTGGTAATYAGLDNFDRIQQQAWLSTTAGTLDQFNYRYDLAGNRLTRQNLAGTSKDEQYTYDRVYRLYTSTQGSLSGGTISVPVHTEAWGLDATGNWNTYSSSGSWGALSQTRSHNTANQLLSIAGTGAATLNYDQAGNTTVLPVTPTGGTLALSGSCTYDAWNRLMSISGGTGTVLPGFSYDGLGRRIQKSIVGGGTTDYYLDDQQVVETQFTSGGTTGLQFQYVCSPRYIDAAVLRDDFTSGRAYPTVYYLNDANMNVTSLVAFAGAAWVQVERYVYSAYGAPRFYNGGWTWIGTSTAKNAVLYTGRELDPETGLYYYRARYNSAGLGRFITRDPMEYQGGLNLYGYCDNDPVIVVDPSGLRWAVERKKLSQATACVHEDTVTVLAQKIGLKASDYKEWLTPDLTPLPASENEVIHDGNYLIPNKIICWWAGDATWVGGRGWVGWNDDVKYLGDLGFATTEISHHRNTFLWELETSSKKKELHGLMVFGHGERGDTPGIGPGGAEIPFATLHKKLRYDLGFALLNACWSDPKGRVLVAKPNGVFGGHVGLLNPDVPDWLVRKRTHRKPGHGYDLSAPENQIEPIRHPKEIIHPGEQGTYPPSPFKIDEPGGA